MEKKHNEMAFFFYTDNKVSKLENWLMLMQKFWYTKVKNFGEKIFLEFVSRV